MKLNYEGLENLNRPVTSEAIEGYQKPPNIEKTRTRWFPGDFYYMFKELTIVLSSFSKNVKEDRMLPNSFYETNITLMSMQDKDITSNGKHRLISLMNIDAKILNKIPNSKPNSTVQ